MRWLLLVLALTVCVVLPASANAKAPCRDQVFNDWYPDGKIASKYPLACYRDALKHIPPTRGSTRASATTSARVAGRGHPAPG